MEEIINNGSAAAASCPGFGTPEDMLDIGVDMGEEEVEEEDVAEEVEEEESADQEPTWSKGRKNKKHAANGQLTEPCIKWTTKEDECRAEAWKTISMDLITSANQNAETYWRRIKMAFDEGKLVDP
ncbi:putative methionyl-tRNA synthetase [Hordeum vulgare]|nr:putative methionyl-tRNA synthetase [Hordeum vulgare]